MKMTASEIFKEMKKGTFRPIYLLVGEEPFQVSEILARFKEILFGADLDAGSFNIDSFSGENLDIDKMCEACDIIPGLFDGEGRRLVICHRFEKAAGKNLDGLVRYLENPSPSSSLILVSATVDKRKSWYKIIEQNGAVLPLSEPAEREWPKWQRYLETKIGKTLQPAVWEVLLEASDRRLGTLWKELEKISLYAANKQTIELSDIDEFAFSGKSKNVFEFVDAVMKRDKFSVIRLYRELEQDGENELKLFSLVVRQFRLLEQYSVLGRDSKEMATKLGVHPFVVKKLSEQHRFHKSDVQACLESLSICDLKLKTGRGTFYDDFLVPYVAGDIE